MAKSKFLKKSEGNMSGIKSTILVISDNPTDITLLNKLLQIFYKVHVASDYEEALALMDTDFPDIILLDIEMSKSDGYKVSQSIKSKDFLSHIPLLFLSSKKEVAEERKAFEFGAADFLSKPIDSEILLSRMKIHLASKHSHDLLKAKNHSLAMEISERIKETAIIQEGSIMAMSVLAEIRNSETGYHIQRTKLFVKELCEYLSNSFKYNQILTPPIVDLIVAASPLHDIGKIGIPDSILLKPGKLTDIEFEVIKTHATLGREAILRAEELMDLPEEFLKYPKEIVYLHHEKWDGSGYPEGISGEEIPLSARVVALADVYDALTSKRIYKPAFSHFQAVDIIQEESGKHFDPDIVHAFVQLNERFKKIAKRYQDD